MEKQIDLEQYGNLPRHVRESLATAEEKQPSKNIEKEDVPSSETQSQPNVIEHTLENNEPLATDAPPAESQDHQKNENDVSAWKGRLNKLQAEHKNTEERLLAEAEARQKAEQEAKELREKYAALEQQHKQPSQTEAESQPSQPPQAQDQFTDEELAEMEVIMGATGKKFADYLRRTQSKQELPVVDVNKVVDEKLAQERQRNAEQARIEAFGKAVQEQTPKLQGLLNNSAFIEFANAEVIDFAGNTAAQLLNFVGANQRTDLLPKVAELIAKFEQSRQPQTPPPTVPPSSKGASVDVRNTGKKPKPNAAILEKMARLARMGNVDELKALQDKYDLD